LNSSARLVTLTGPPGVGKSRLAGAVFHDLTVAFDNGTFADLSRAAESLSVAPALASAVGVDAAGGAGGREASSPQAGTAGQAPEVLIERLRDHRSLIVIDHCEHVLDGVARLVGALLGSCPDVHILVLSDEPLRVYEEQLFGLAPLEVPDLTADRDLPEFERIDSVRLLLNRVNAVRPNFKITAENRADIAELCVRLDGLPLAIELAAAQLKLFTPRHLVAELGRGLEILRGGEADTVSRHRSMRDAIAWSVSRLTPEEQALFRQLAVFSREFGYAAAEAIVGEDRLSEVLGSLVDKHLVVAHEQGDGELGFRMLNMTRAYALEQLASSAETDRARRMHATYFLSVAQASEHKLAGTGQQGWLAQISRWRDDFSSAFRFFADHRDGASAAALAAALRLYWLWSGRLQEGVAWLTESLGISQVPDEVAARARLVAGELAAWLRTAAAETHIAEARRTSRKLKDHKAVATSIHLEGKLAYLLGDLAAADRLLRDAIARHRTWGNRGGTALAMVDLAQVRQDSKSAAEARHLAENALTMFRLLDDPRGEAHASLAVASAVADSGNLADAQTSCCKTIRMLHDLDERLLMPVALELLSTMLASTRVTATWLRAVRLRAAATALREKAGCPLPAHLQDALSDFADLMRNRLHADRFDQAWLQGAKLTLTAAVSEAVAPVSAGPEPDSAVDVTGPLTRREYEVAGFVARGMTNRQVARTMGIAEWTVVNHLRKIMRKLDCTSRVEVARWMFRRPGSSSGEALAAE